MDGENNGKPYEQMDDLGVKPPIFGNTHIDTQGCRFVPEKTCSETNPPQMVAIDLSKYLSFQNLALIQVDCP